MALAKATIEALTQMANTLRQSADDILATKEQMDDELRSIPWDDPIGLAFIGRYEEDFKPLKEKLIPNIEDYVQYMNKEGMIVSEYSGETSNYIFLPFNPGKPIFISPSPQDICVSQEIQNTSDLTEEQCKRWGFSRDGRIKGYRVKEGDDGVLTVYNYKMFNKEEVLKGLSAGVGVKYRIEDLGPFSENKGVAGKWHEGRIIKEGNSVKKEESYMRINKNFIDSNSSNSQLIEVFFHENQHRIQYEKIRKGCYVNGNNISMFAPPPTQHCINELRTTNPSRNCLTEFKDYYYHWSEIDAREAGETARKWFEKQAQQYNK